MPAATRTYHIRAALGVALVVAGGLIGWRLFRNPLADLPHTDHAAGESAAAGAIVLPPLPPRPSNRYVGSVVCAECHQEISRQYQSHPMARSMADVRVASPIENFGTDHGFKAARAPRTDFRLKYHIERNPAGSQIHHEVLVDGLDNVLYDHAVPVHFEVGSGQRGRSYITNRNGLLFMSPITWYSTESRWNLSPGYDQDNPHFERRIMDGCVVCHAGRVAVVEGQPDRYQSEPFFEAAIGCERCHGPGEEHIRRQRGHAPQASVDTIIDPANLEPRRRESVCFQCHFVGQGRIARYGRTDFDFRPGDDINDVWTTLIGGTRVSADLTTEAVSQVEQMLSSRCYRDSNGSFGCTSCHDPHQAPDPGQRVEFYRERCQRCHAAGQQGCALPVEQRLASRPDDSCTACHMPQIPANDVPHTSQTDHRVLRSYASQPEPTRSGKSTVSIFEEELGRIPAAELDRARGLFLVKDAERAPAARFLAHEAISLLRPWNEAAPDDRAVADGLGAAYWLNGDVASAVQTWQRGLEVNPDDEPLLRRLVEACDDSEQFELGLSYARRLLAIDAWDHTYWGRYAHMLGGVGRFEEGIQAAQRALELNPASFRIHSWIADAYVQVGNDVAAREHRELYLQLTTSHDEQRQP